MVELPAGVMGRRSVRDDGRVVSGGEPPVPASADEDVERHFGEAAAGLAVEVEGDPTDLGDDNIWGGGEGVNDLVAG